MLSTVAFDGIKGRPVVTNIFGTAHAYVDSANDIHISEWIC
jgi:gamma-glutamyl phosphate reductase